MSTRYYLAGNALIGDALLSVGWFLPTERQYDRHVVVCNQYNRGVFEFLRDHTRHVIDSVVVLDDYDRLRIWDDFHRYCDRITEQYTTDAGAPVRLAWPLAFGHEGHHAKAIPVIPWDPEPAVIDEPYITMQVDSIHRFKYNHHLANMTLPLPIVCVTRRNERCHAGHAVRVDDVHLSRAAEILMGATLHIGIASSLTRFAAQLGTPTIMCCTDRTQARNVGLARTPGLHLTLVSPTRQAVEQQAGELLAAVLRAHVHRGR